MIRFKQKNDSITFFSLAPILVLIAADMDVWLVSRGYPGLIITEGITTEEMDISANRKTLTHREGRAIDVRTHDIDIFDIQDLIKFIEDKYGFFGAISSETGDRNLIVFGDKNHLDHMHIQVARFN